MQSSASILTDRDVLLQSADSSYISVLALLNDEEDKDFVLYSQEFCHSFGDPLLHNLPVDLLPLHRKRVLCRKFAALQQLALLAVHAYTSVVRLG